MTTATTLNTTEPRETTQATAAAILKQLSNETDNYTILNIEGLQFYIRDCHARIDIDRIDPQTPVAGHEDGFNMIGTSVTVDKRDNHVTWSSGKGNVEITTFMLTLAQAMLDQLN